MTKNEALVIREKVVNGEMVEQAGGIKVVRTTSDKVGFDWDNYYVNDILVRQVYVEKSNPEGTADNPIPWAADLELMQNAYYINEGVRKVWMGEAGVTAAWDDPNFVEW